MSRTRVVVGRTWDGRPVTDWATAPTEDPPYPFMQPAYSTTVTRRKATRAELAASRARDAATGYLHAKPAVASRRVGTWTPEASAERMRVSRERGVVSSHASPAQQRWNDTKMRPMLTAAEAIVAEVAVMYGVSVADTLGRSRQPRLVDARAAAAQRMATELGVRHHVIAKALGGRDRSTVTDMLRRPVG